MINRCGQTWEADGALYLILETHMRKHEAIRLDADDGTVRRWLWEFRGHEWGERGHGIGLRRIA